MFQVLHSIMVFSYFDHNLVIMTKRFVMYEIKREEALKSHSLQHESFFFFLMHKAWKWAPLL